MTNEEEIKALRHSFTNPYREDLPKPKKNQFGHTVLNSNGEDIDLENFELSFDESGQVKASSKDYWVEKLNGPDLTEIEPVVEETPRVIPTNLTGPVNRQSSLIRDLISELDQMDGTAESSNIHPATFRPSDPVSVNTQSKNCHNPECLYALPKDAKFCLKCGTPQLAKFCIECGHGFNSLEKFCPDCGTKR